MDERIKKLYKSGLSIAEIHRQTSKCRPYIVKILREAGLKSKKKNMAYSRGKGSKSLRWSGGRNVSSGYVRIKMPNHHRALSNGYVWEHIVVAEKKIGRPLRYYGKGNPRNENVHHKNGNKADNRPENLKIMSTLRQHAKAEWRGDPLKFPQSKQSKRKTKDRYDDWYTKNAEAQSKRARRRAKDY